MISYLKGFLRSLFKQNISKLAFLTSDSQVSSKAVVKRLCKVYKSSIDAFSYIAPHTELICCNIGKYCSIAKNCKLGLGTHTLNFLSTSPIFTEKKNALGIEWIQKDAIETSFKPVTIGNDVWIGENAVILGGISIGDGAVIGAGAIVTKEVPPYTIVGGVPAKKIRSRFPDDIVKMLLKIQWWNLEEDILKENIYFFQQNLSEDNLTDFAKVINSKLSNQ